MNLELTMLLLLIGLSGSVLSGLLGMGGAMLTFPMLLYLPKALGVAEFTTHQVSGIVALQVVFSALSGLWAFRRQHLLHGKLIVYMGTSVLLGSTSGGYGARFLPETTVQLLYAVLATLSAIALFIPKRSAAAVTQQDLHFHRGIAIVVALMVGSVSGVVGVGGGFLLIPALIYILNIPLRMAIACSMAITFISSAGTSIGKILSMTPPLLPTVVIVFASLVGAPIGATIANHIRTKVLKWIGAALIFAISIKMWMTV